MSSLVQEVGTSLTFPSFLDNCPLRYIPAFDDDGRCSMKYVVFKNDEEQLFLKARMELEGQAWLAFGMSPTGLMVPGDVIIGSPNYGIAQLYETSSYALNGTGISPKVDQSTLSEVALNQTEDSTVMEFITLVNLETDVLFNAEDNTYTFIWAHGFSNDQGFHEGYGQVALDLSIPCTEVAVEEEQEATSIDDVCRIRSIPALDDDGQYSMEYIVFKDDEEKVFLKAQMKLQRQAWLAVGMSPTGLMVPGNVIIGSPMYNAVNLFETSSYAINGTGLAMKDDQSALSDLSLVQDGESTMMEFTALVNVETDVLYNEEDDTYTFIWAHGFSNDPGFHEGYGQVALDLSLPCSKEVASTISFNVQTHKPTESPSVPSSANPSSAVDVDEVSSTSSSGKCLDYQFSIQLNENLLFNYVVFEDKLASEEDDEPVLYLKAQLVYFGKAWLGFGVSTDGKMLGAELIIGYPSSSGDNIRQYGANSYDPSGSGVYVSEQQLLTNALMQQNSTTTVMGFTRPLDDPNGIDLKVGSSNKFLYAYGFGNRPGIHQDYGSFTLDLGLCDQGSGEFDLVEAGDRYETMYAAHGMLASIAWGILVPLAIGSALLRKWITKCSAKDGLWYKFHFYLNALALMMTTISFGLAVIARQRTTPSGENPKHFTAFAHATVGLLIMILLLVQVFGGILRPKDKEASKRVVWLLAHRLLGVGLLLLCWYQVQDGLTLFATLFNYADYSTVFWCVAGSIGGINVLGKILTLHSTDEVITKNAEKTEQDIHNDDNDLTTQEKPQESNNVYVEEHHDLDDEIWEA